MRLNIVYLLVALISGCALRAPIFGPSPEQIFAAFKKDEEICWAFLERIDSDPDAKAEFRTAMDFGGSGQWEEILRSSSQAKSEEFRYVLANGRYFGFAAASFHGNQGADAVNGGLVCTRTLQRLRDIETLPISSQAWMMRQHYLDLFLADLAHPGDEGPQPGFDFATLKKEVEEAAKLYLTARPDALRVWIRKAMAKVEQMRSTIQDGSGGLSAAEQNKIFDGWIAFLRDSAKLP